MIFFNKFAHLLLVIFYKTKMHHKCIKYVSIIIVYFSRKSVAMFFKKYCILAETFDVENTLAKVSNHLHKVICDL